jgi:hypothetical protein
MTTLVSNLKVLIPCIRPDSSHHHSPGIRCKLSPLIIHIQAHNSFSHDELWRVEEAFTRILGLVSHRLFQKTPIPTDAAPLETPPLPTSLWSGTSSLLLPNSPNIPKLTTTIPQYNDLLLQALSVRGYTHCIIWDQDTQDGFQVPASQSKDVYNGSGGGDIILGHSVYASTADDVVPYGIQVLKGKGLDLVSVDTCLGSQGSWPYTYVGEAQSGGWQC